MSDTKLRDLERRWKDASPCSGVRGLVVGLPYLPPMWPRRFRAASVLLLASTLSATGCAPAVLGVVLATSVGGGGSSRASNAAPHAEPIAVVVPEDGRVRITLMGSDPDGDPLRWSVLNAPARGRLQGTPPRLFYEPLPDVNGEDDFSFSVSDGQGGSDAAEVTITITPVNDPPQAKAANVMVVDARPGPIRLAASDVDGDALSFVVVQSPTLGVLSGTPPDLTYLSQIGGVGSDSFVFEVADTTGAASQATVSIGIGIDLRVTRVTPDRGPKAGGDLLTIEGEGFTVDTMVDVGGLPCASVAVIDSTTLTCRVPAGELGPADVVVAIATTRHTVVAANGYSYEGIEPERTILGGVPGSSGPERTSSSIAASGDVVVCAWYDIRGGGDVHFTRSTDGGRSWPLVTRALNDVDPFASQRGPSIAISGDLVVCVWEDERNGRDRDIWGVRSVDGGATWSANFRIDASPSGSSQEPVVVVSGVDVTVAWSDGRNGGFSVYSRHSSDGGQTWEPEVRIELTAVPSHARTPALAASGSNVVCVWTDRRVDSEIYSRTSADGGRTWSATDVRVNDASPANQERPAVAIVGTTVLCAWEDSRNADGNLDVYATISTTGGATWPGVAWRVDDNGPATARDVSVGSDGASFLCAWSHGQPGGVRPRLTRTLDPTAWPASVDIGGAVPMYHARPSLAAASGRAWCAFGSGPIVATRSDDGGTTWQPPQAVSREPAYQTGCNLTVDPLGIVHAVWIDDREDAAGDLFYARSFDRTLTWSPHTKVNSTVGSHEIQQPALVATAAALVVAWADSRDGDFDIYVRRSLDGGATFEPLEREISADATSSHQFFPSLAAVENTIVCTWIDQQSGQIGPNDALVSRSLDDGATWSAPVRLNDATLNNQTPTGVAMIGSTVVVVYTDESADRGDIRVRRSLDGGATWTGPSIGVSANQGGGVRQRGARLAMSGADVVVVWEDDVSGYPRTQSAHSSDGGATWSSAAFVSPSLAGKTEAEVLLAGKAALCVWSDFRGTAFASRSVDAGASWLPEFEIPFGGYMARGHATADGWFYVFWTTSRIGSKTGAPRLLRAFFKP